MVYTVPPYRVFTESVSSQTQPAHFECKCFAGWTANANRLTYLYTNIVNIRCSLCGCTCIGYIREQERPHCFEKLLSLSFRIIIVQVPKVFCASWFSGKHFVKFTNESCDELSIGRGKVMSSIHDVNVRLSSTT